MLASTGSRLLQTIKRFADDCDRAGHPEEIKYLLDECSTLARQRRPTKSAAELEDERHAREQRRIAEREQAMKDVKSVLLDS
jgi:hypothetical protein